MSNAAMSNAVAFPANTTPTQLPFEPSASPPSRFPQVHAIAQHEHIVASVTGLQGSGVALLRPFHIVVEPDEEYYIATSPIALVYEHGETWQEALRNYLEALLEHFRWLDEIEDSLGLSVQGELALLREYLRLEK